jgi:hypothetical protein
MKNYFNAQERNRHILVMGLLGIAEEFLNSNAPTDDEKRAIDNACKHLRKFNKSVFNRFGQAYANAVLGTVEINKLVMVSKALPTADCLSYSAAEDLKIKLKDLQLMNCLDCERCDFKDCAVYGMMVSCGMDATCESGCPFKM